MESIEADLAVPPRTAFWAKRRPYGWHPLEAHLLDVGAVIHVLLAPGAPLAHRIRSMVKRNTEAEDIRRLAVYAGLLHDIGKVHHGFQAQRSGWADFPRSSHVQRFITELRVARRLGIASEIVSEIRSAALAPIKQLSPRDATAHEWLTGVIAHHGRPFAPSRMDVPEPWHRDWLPDDGRDPGSMARRIIEQAVRLSGIEAHVTPPDERTSHFLAGVLTLADWLGSSEELFPLTSRSVLDSDAYWSEAVERARRGLQSSGTRRALRASVPTTWPGLFPAIADRATALQRLLSDCQLPDPGALLVVESDTGSGKTEAALSLFARLRGAGQVDGLFFALPTRATASAMRDRIMRFAERVMPEAARNLVLAAGGYAASSLESDAEPEDSDENAAAIRWASRSLAKSLAGELVVGTIDQALLAVLPAKHAHLRLAALHRLLFVVDELHAYDRYMLTLLSELIAYLRANGATVVAMSATLASSATARLAKRPDAMSLDAATSVPFPSVTQIAADGSSTIHAVASPAERARIYCTSMSDERHALAEAVRRAESGARILIIRNTVAKAIDTVSQLSATHQQLLFGPDGHPAIPYHSRYTPADRTALDDAVRASFSPGGRATASILVATQVAEQSLDVDFDYLVTDLCPIDVLLQRLGRVHRHIRTRPVGCEEPSASIILPEIALREGTSGHGHASLRALGLGSVYQDLVTLELTVRLLERQPMLEIPEGSRALIEAVYHPSPREALGASDDAWGAYLIRQEGEESGRRSLAMQLRIPLFSRGYSSREVCDLFRMTSDQELQARTRLGDDRVIIPLPVPVAHHFTSAPADSVLSLEWRKLRLDPGQPIPAAELVRSDSPFTVQLGRVLLQYQRVGWVSTLAPGSAE